MSIYTLDITSSMIQEARNLALQTLEATTYSKFKESFLALNATVRGYNPSEQLQFRDHEEQVCFRGNTIWIAPESSSIDELFETAWNKSKDFEVPLERAGYLYHAIYATHVCRNGNGRTGRALYYSENNEGAAFKDLVWSKDMLQGLKICSEIGSTHEHLDSLMRHKLKEVSGNINAESLILIGCDFTDPWYWRFVDWNEGIPSHYQSYLEEKHDPNLRFPHIVILQVAIEEGLIDPKSLQTDARGLLRVDIVPAEIIGMNTYGEKVYDALRREKVSFVRSFLNDHNAIISNAVRQSVNTNTGFRE
jgi:hypothetical protein